jgi:uncharacterized protein (DUF2252 family)
VPKSPMRRPYPAFEDRAGVLSDAQRLKMARSPHAYVRGATARFYEWLQETDAARRIPEGPPVWICGDCHANNLGPLANAKGKIAIQIRDLDQTVIGNPAHDLIRLGLSLATAARGSNLPGVTTAKMLEHMIEGYEAALADDAAPDDFVAPKAVRSAMKQAGGRRWKHLARERIADLKPAIPLGRTFWPLTEEERAGIAALGADEATRHLVTSLHSRDRDQPIEVLDAAYWMKGCSSLGRLRYAVLIGVGKPDADDRDTCLIDIKEATQAMAPRAAGAAMPRDNAARVVAGARALAPNLGDRMLAGRLLDRSVVLRELMPQDLKLEIDRLSQEEAVNAARYLATVVGVAHARQMDEPTRQAWRAELQRNRTKTLDAPSWLWSSIVELIVSHEAAYLDHCRRYALAA